MAKDGDQVRLPELPIFKKYSLALRQEFASPKEILNVLDRTANKIQRVLEKAEAQQRNEQVEVEDELASGAEQTAPAESEPDTFTAESEPSRVPELEPDDAVFRLLDESQSEAQPDVDDRPIWEPEPSSPPPAKRAKGKVPKRRAKISPRKRAPKRTRVTRTKPRGRTSPRAIKKAKPRPEIVRVSSRGRPIKGTPSPRRSPRRKAGR